jgi:hypothetical protein
MKRCPYCGADVSDTAKACGHCGRWLPAEPQPEGVAPPVPAAPPPLAPLPVERHCQAGAGKGVKYYALFILRT